MSTEDVKTHEMLQRVGNMIEQSMVRYMNKKQVIDYLYQRHNVDPEITRNVWEKLEKDNKDFFKAYNLRLLLQDQITQFNNLLSKQFSLFDQMNQHGILSNRHHIPIPTMNHNAPCNYAPENTHVKIESMQSPFPAVVAGGFNGCGPSEMQSGTLNMVVAQNLNGGIRNGPGYLGNSNFFNHEIVNIAPVSSFGNMNSVPHQLNGPFVDDSSSVGYWQHFNRSDMFGDFFFSTDS